MQYAPSWGVTSIPQDRYTRALSAVRHVTSMLKLQLKDKSQNPLWVTEKNFTLGSGEEASLRIANLHVADLHARIVASGDEYLLKDLDSEHGTFVNNQRITQRAIQIGDTLRLGPVEVEVLDPNDTQFTDIGEGQVYWSLIADASWLTGQEFPLVGDLGQILTVGRSAQCDLVFPGTHLSRQHAEITIDRHELTLKDLDSANGTFVNDRQIDIAKIVPGDRVRFDVYSFQVFGPGAKSRNRDSDQLDPANHKLSQSARWQSKPTSPGNREELNLYKRKIKPTLIAGLVGLSVIALATYIILAITGVIH